MKTHVIPISGKDSLTTALLQTAHEPQHDYIYFFNDTGTELPETYEWLDRVEEKTGFDIKRVGEDLEEIIRDHGILPSQMTRFCTREAKIEPMEEYLGEMESVIYYGLRADEPLRSGYQDGKNYYDVRYPLREMNIDLRGVWTILDEKDLLPPSFFWDELHDRVTDILPEEQWAPPLEPWEEHTLFAGRSRSNCFHCFYQRQYEWVWLHDEHPDLFEKAQEMEETIGGDDYVWDANGNALEDFVDRREEIIDRRADQVAQIIAERSQEQLFGEERGAINQTSCGMLCGK